MDRSSIVFVGKKRGTSGQMFKRVRLGPQPMRRIRHWGMELAVVVGGVLLALWAQAWFEGRKEGRIHSDTVEQIDDLFGRALVQTAARVSSSSCSRERIAELDNALRSSTGHWTAMPIRNLPDYMNVGHYPVVYVIDSDVFPVQIFDTARQSGTMAALEPADRLFYGQVERELNWLNEVWQDSTDFVLQLSILGVDGPLSEIARDDIRQALAWLDGENRITILRARSLTRLARERGVKLASDDLATYRKKIERDRRLFGDCVVEIDPLESVPVTGTMPTPAGGYR